jgi:N-methylhydantoinase A/oxoprolinase/acetone carboxylase beta subunit
MINQIEHGPVVAITKDTQTAVNYFGRVVTALFNATLERLYAAYLEKTQMRLAPTTIYFDRLEHREQSGQK